MSKYGSIVPENISSNEFDFHGASIEIECDNMYPRYKPYMYFISGDGYDFPSSANTPPHFVEIKSSSPLIIDRFDFMASWDLVYMTAKDYKIETSMNGETWDTVYSGTVPDTRVYTKECEFEPTVCRYLKFTVLSTYDRRGYKWYQGGFMKVYGALAGNNLYTNQHADAIPK